MVAQIVLIRLWHAIAPLVLFVLLMGYGSLSPAVTDDAVHYNEVLAQVNSELHSSLSISAARPASWVHLERVAEAYLSRAQLTGNFNDYVEAQKTLSQAFAGAQEDSGPVLTRARLHFSIHRLPDVEPDLVRAESALLVNSTTTQLIEALRADVLFYSGQYRLALSVYLQHEDVNPSVMTASRLAHYYASVGDYSAAEQWFYKAEQRVSGHSSHLRSWLKLQLGILYLERGRLDDALIHYKKGLSLFPGFWLIEEHVAEIHALQGRDKLAEVAYRDLILRTESPQFMAALADILSSRADISDQLEAEMWLKQAMDIYLDRIRKLPELVSGHAVDFFLQSDDSAQALELANFNYQLRPDGAGALLLIQAYAVSGQTTEAARLLDATLTTPYRSADIHATAGLLYRISGDVQLADRHDADALAINPTALQGIDWLRKKLNLTSSATAVF